MQNEFYQQYTSTNIIQLFTCSTGLTIHNVFTGKSIAMCEVQGALIK